MLKTRIIASPRISFALALLLTGCATVGGTIVGGTIGGIAGDARMGAVVGGTTGAVIDIFGR